MPDFMSITRDAFRPSFGVPAGVYKWTNCRWEVVETNRGEALYFKADLIPYSLKEKRPIKGAEPVEWNLSNGSASDWVPSKDGKRLKRSEGSMKMSFGSTNFSFAMYTHGVDKAGLDEDLFSSGSVAALEGVIASMHDVTQPKRNLTPLSGEDEGRERTISVPEKVYFNPSPKKAEPAEDEGDNADEEPSDVGEENEDDVDAADDADDAGEDPAGLFKKHAKAVLSKNGALTATRFRILLQSALAKDGVDNGTILAVMNAHAPKNDAKLEASLRAIGAKKVGENFTLAK